jgi:hypothetical protein
MRNVILLALAFASLAFAEARPKVRAITAFIRMDAAHLETQIAEAVKFLSAAREEYKAAGFEVETIRVVTQPLADYTKGMKHADALALLRKYAELAARMGFSPNLGAVQLTDDDERSTVDLAIDAFAYTRINGSLVVAAENGIHWKSIREAARLVKAPHGLRRRAHGEHPRAVNGAGFSGDDSGRAVTSIRNLRTGGGSARTRQLRPRTNLVLFYARASAWLLLPGDHKFGGECRRL